MNGHILSFKERRSPRGFGGVGQRGTYRRSTGDDSHSGAGKGGRVGRPKPWDVGCFGVFNRSSNGRGSIQLGRKCSEESIILDTVLDKNIVFPV
ncbi:hypothetical protein GWI33_016855 [Rhynchophorus ferrugineus]|uniref:Uncharacterized protein n=1 Tax=Rhynchophorus ferrugineus TaxID=354439 RepID=A0A834M890_RHYFE|nr:hypothetical protein GWI33_016855 [Rhynchophorus ferrugineus]